MIILLGAAAVLAVSPMAPTASAQELQATPIHESESELDTQRNVSPANAPLATGKAFLRWEHPQILDNISSGTYTFAAVSSPESVDYDVPGNRLNVSVTLTVVNTNFNQTNTQSDPGSGEIYQGLSFQPESTAFQTAAAASCKANNGLVLIDLEFHVSNMLTGSVLERESTRLNLPCSVKVTPQKAIRAETRCGPGNDIVFFPIQPDDVTVTDSGWQGTQRKITYVAADWASLIGISSNTFNDFGPPCDVSATVTVPESLPFIHLGGDEYGVRVDYDFTNIWPAGTVGNVRIDVDGTGDTVLNATSTHQVIAPDSNYTYWLFFDNDVAALKCYTSNGTISVDVTVSLFATNGTYPDIPLWSDTFHVETDCSVAVYPRSAMYYAEACGYNDDRIIVPIQGGIHSHAITWNGNVATIEYTPMPVHEIVGGPFTVTIIEPPCYTGPVSPSTLEPVCGIENDRVVLPAPMEGVLFEDGTWIDGVFHFQISPLPGWQLPEGQQTEFALVDPGDCEIEGLTAPVHTAVCGIHNDTVTVPEGIENVTITTAGDMAVDGSVTVTYTPDEHYRLPNGIDAEYVFVDAGDCPVTPVAPAVPVAVCGPNNDIVTIPTQPDNLSVNDHGWQDNERVIEFIPADGYALADGVQSLLTFTDADIACEVDPVGTTLVLKFETSDGGSLEGESWEFYAPVASQALHDPYLEGEIGAGNQVVLEEIIAGTYRVVVDADGYEPVDAMIIVTAQNASEEHVIEVMAIQPVVTPTPSPTVEPTVEPTKPAVTGLPATGSGSDNGLAWISLTLVAITILAASIRRAPKR